jgi:hypothetical protein
MPCEPAQIAPDAQPQQRCDSQDQHRAQPRDGRPAKVPLAEREQVRQRESEVAQRLISGRRESTPDAYRQTFTTAPAG